MARISVTNIKQAATVIDPVFLHTPQFVCEPLNDELGASLLLKVETLNPIRSFKGRGAEWLVEKETHRRAICGAGEQHATLVCASAGNFGQAMAYACRKRSIPLTVFAAETANPLKVERMRRLGATVVISGQDFDAAKIAARRHADDSQTRFVEDGRDVETAEGAGTISLELATLDRPLDALMVPLGNGGLFNGVATVIRARWPQTRLIAVQAAGAPAMIESWRSGRVVTHEQIDTIADGIGVRVPIPEALDDMRDLIDDAIVVAEETIVRAMQLVHQHAGLVVEPSAAVGVAAILEYPERFHDLRIGTILCGGNLTQEQITQWVAPQAR